MNRGRECASCADHGLGRQRIRNTKQRRSGSQDGSSRHIRLADAELIRVVGDAVRFSSEAARRLRLHTAVEAFAACDRTRPADAISDLAAFRRASPSQGLRPSCSMTPTVSCPRITGFGIGSCPSQRCTSVPQMPAIVHPDHRFARARLWVRIGREPREAARTHEVPPREHSRARPRTVVKQAVATRRVGLPSLSSPL